MFDPYSRKLLRSAPELPALDPLTLDELLTEAHIELATVRLLAGDEEKQPDVKIFQRVRRLASTFEAYVALNLRPEKMKAAAYVAATAHQILSRLRGTNYKPTLLSSDAIGSELSATLLFLIADRAADAAESAIKLRVNDEIRDARRTLILCVREFATGAIASVIERDLENVVIPRRDSREYATDLLFLECARAIQALANEAMNSNALTGNTYRLLNKVVSLSQASKAEPGVEFEGTVYNQFAGPHHLASLLGYLVEGVQASMIARLPVPAGANKDKWYDWVHTQSHTRPFLWVNHLKAIRTGYLDRGQSMVMTSPTGSGKTTLSILKIAAILCAGESVIYLAPTHALVEQVEEDLSGHIGVIEPVSIEDSTLEELGEKLPSFSVMTPERCLALQGFAPKLFENVGLMVFDEFHLIGTDEPSQTDKINTRAIDSMLAFLTFLKLRPDADMLLLSAMVANGEEIARWLKHVTGREVSAFNDPWKPTRQLRSCVIYSHSEIKKARKFSSYHSTKAERQKVLAQPLGLFSLISGWHPQRPEKLVVRALTKNASALSLNNQDYLTSNRNHVAAQIAAEYAALGQRVIVFCNDSRACGSVAKELNELLKPASVPLNTQQEAFRISNLEDVGAENAVYNPVLKRAAVHHGDLLPLERKLTESIFRARREDMTEPGLDVIAATSTIAQGLNLPCDVVILAGTDRSTADDPEGNPRKELRPHEILNAMGRAGRAAYSAIGLAIVIPAKPIVVDPGKLVFAGGSVLNILFSDKDACEEILDPIERLLDQIETTASPDPKLQAMIRRLSAVADDGASGFDEIVRRSFGYFRKKTANASVADRWLKKRREALVKAEASLSDPVVLDWQQEIAVRNGMPPRLIERLSEALQLSPVKTGTTVDWVRWLLNIIDEHPSDLNIFVRATALESVFGRAYSNTNDREKTDRLLLRALKKLVYMWCSGKTLVNIESWLLAFVRRYEGQVRREASHSVVAQRARRFVIRIVPDLGFLCGLLGQVASHLSEEQGLPKQPVIELLPQMLRYGDANRHQMVLRQANKISSRVKTYQRCNKLNAYFSAGASASIEEIRKDVSSALLAEALKDSED